MELGCSQLVWFQGAALDWSAAFKRCPELSKLIDSACTSYSLSYYNADSSGGTPEFSCCLHSYFNLEVSRL